jgi:hypothetical protein
MQQKIETAQEQSAQVQQGTEKSRNGQAGK